MANSPNKNPTHEELQFTPSSTSSPPSSSPPPPPPPVIPSGPGGSSDGDSGKKNKKENQGEGGSGQKKRSEMDALKSDPICSLCGKEFGSWKGVYGHMRAHPERKWGGAFPPVRPEVGARSPIRDQPVPVTAHHLTAPTDEQTWEGAFPPPNVEADWLMWLLEMSESDPLMRLVEMSQSDSTTAAITDWNEQPEEAASSIPPPPLSAGDGLCLDLPPAPASQEDFQEGSAREKSVN